MVLVFIRGKICNSLFSNRNAREVPVKKKTGRTRPKIQTNVLVYGKKIGPDNAQQAGTI